MIILGVAAFYHDSSACIVVNGAIMAAVQEERFTRVKQDASFPFNAISYCLETAGVKIKDVDKIIFYDDPSLKFKRILTTYVDFFPKSIPFIFRSLPSWLTKKVHWKKSLLKDFKDAFDEDLDSTLIENIPHHRSHAASAFYPSPFNDAAILVLDGVGEFDTTSLWVGEGNRLRKVESVMFPHSIGLLYSAITYFLGFKVNSGEYKVMGLAPYGEPKYVDLIKDNLINISETGKFTLNMDYFSFAVGKRMTSDKFDTLFGRSPREPESELGQFEMDLARSIQDVTEDVVLRLARWAKKETGKDNLCLAGGVALNCVGNGKILRDGAFKNIWIQPAAGDAGGSLGAALDYHYSVLKNDRQRNLDMPLKDEMKGSYLGPCYSDENIKSFLLEKGASFDFHESFDELLEGVSERLASGDVVGWHQGRMEFGPRSLGNRSILGDPRSTKMQTVMNLKIKYRESFRPFAPSVLAEKVEEWFDIDVLSPYMLLVAPVTEDKLLVMTGEEEGLFGIDRLNIPRSKIPAVTHVDYSARVQTVAECDNEKYYKLLKSFEIKTQCPVLINTSFNVRGEPIVCTPEDSYRCFMRTEMDVLVVGNFVMYKENQPKLSEDGNWKEEFQLD